MPPVHAPQGPDPPRYRSKLGENALRFTVEQYAQLMSYQSLSAISAVSKVCRDTVSACPRARRLRDSSAYASAAFRAGLSLRTLLRLSRTLGSFVHSKYLVEHPLLETYSQTIGDDCEWPSAPLADRVAVNAQIGEIEKAIRLVNQTT